MPKVWVFNAEEVASSEDLHYDKVLVPKIQDILIRFVLCLGRDDLLIAPGSIPEEFVRYTRRVKGFPESFSPILRLRRKSNPWHLADSVFEDGELLETLRGLGRRGGWVIEPYIESPRVVRLCRAVRMPTDKTNADLALAGIIIELNEKARFKDFAASLGIPTPPGRVAGDRAGIVSAMEELARVSPRLILRKSRYGGGMGNLVGTPDDILRKLPDWYNEGEVLVECFLEFSAVAGTLATITHDSVRYWGADQQAFERSGWVGFSFPFCDRAAAARLCSQSLRIANAVHRRRARGEMNLDWGLRPDGSGGLEPVALECNLRHNGFGHMLRFAEGYFPGGLGKLRIRYLENIRCGDRDFTALAAALRAETFHGEPILIESPGRRRGVVIVMPPRAGRFAAACFAADAPGLRALEEHLEAALA
ncbi:MAG: hypothetical protein HY927_07645 [Elusimicrobia bacterium]|nr:hypothetical protein [Elusimicrobiota bacterium]